MVNEVDPWTQKEEKPSTEDEDVCTTDDLGIHCRKLLLDCRCPKGMWGASENLPIDQETEVTM